MSKDNKNNLKPPHYPIHYPILYPTVSSSKQPIYKTPSSQPRNNTEIVLKRKMYFDRHEREYGAGFYPQLGEMTSGQYTYISFRLFLVQPIIWTQINESVIYGLDRNNGKDLLDSLNNESRLFATSISNSSGRIIYPYNRQTATFKMISCYEGR